MEQILEQLTESMKLKGHFAIASIASRILGLENVPIHQPMLYRLNAEPFKREMQSLVDTGALRCEGFQVREEKSGDSHWIEISVWGYPGAPEPNALIPKWGGASWIFEIRSGSSAVQLADVYLGHHPKAIALWNRSEHSDDELIEMLPFWSRYHEPNWYTTWGKPMPSEFKDRIEWLLPVESLEFAHY